MIVRDAVSGDVQAIAAIYDREILASTATFDLEPQGEAPHRQRLEAANPLRPVLVAEDGSITGWAALVDASSRAGWRQTGEVVLYVDTAHRGAGIGRILLEALIARGRDVGIHALVARITSDNAASLALHRRCGFSEVGVLPAVGRKFGRWLDVVVMHRLV